MRRRSLLGALSASAGVALLSGCGFRLRQPPPMPFGRIALDGFSPRSRLAADLRQALSQTATVVPAAAQAEVVLQALRESEDKGVVASTASGQVREFQLRVKLDFALRTPAGRELAPPVQMHLTRDMSYSETAALAKEQEEAQLFLDMRADIVAQVLRRLAALPRP